MRGRIALLMGHAVGEYQTVLRRAVTRACRERELDVVMYVGARVDAIQPAQRVRNFVYRCVSPARVSGVLVAGGLSIDCGQARLVEFCRSFAPLPVCIIGPDAPGFSSVGVDDVEGVYGVVSHLLSVHGRRRIAYVSGPTTLSESARRLEGYVRAHRAHGVEIDERLIVEGDFSAQAGVAATRLLLEERRLVLDALVAANDTMAFGASEALTAMGVAIPQEVAVAGFDDSPASRTARPGLTTVRQPIVEQARRAVEQLCERNELSRQELPPSIVLRRSCGCGYRVGPVKRRASIPIGLAAAAAVEQRRTLIARAVARAFGPYMAPAVVWGERLADALLAELRGSSGVFLAELRAVLDELHAEHGVVEDLYGVIGQLADTLQRGYDDYEQERIETMWQQALLMVGSVSTRLVGRERMALEAFATRLQQAGERLTTSLGDEALQKVLAAELPSLGIMDALISLRSEQDSEQLLPWFALQGGRQLELKAEPYPARLLHPASYTLPEGTTTVVTPLSAGSELLGVAVLAIGEGDEIIIHDSLRDYLSAALKIGALHREVVQETVRRQEAQQQQLQRELEIAQRISAQVLPRALSVPGLELSARMLSATEVGGDYYDVLPCNGGAWIGVGDVAGHGLPAGLVMLVIQSSVAALVQAAPEAAPSALVSQLNRAVYEGVRGRLGRDDHATLMLARYEASGQLTFAGAHEDLIVYRARERRCELVPTVGTWIGVLPDIADVTPDSTLQLARGDIVVLYSDGVTEAFDARRQQFGPERICRLVEQLAGQPAQEICDAIVSAVQLWMERQNDDITVMVGRYLGEA